tara:strand:- start:1107 stop:1346 length:240 start_codon:yes stop_codon:yes gene_type:complete
MTNKQLENILKEGWWIQVSPLARLEPTEWLVAVYKKGKKSWITEVSKDGFDDPFEAHQWAMNFIYKCIFKNKKLKKDTA